MRKAVVFSIVSFVVFVLFAPCLSYAEYNPTTGRFLQRDPIGYSDGMNLYEYVNSSPIVYVDTHGEKISHTACESAVRNAKHNNKKGKKILAALKKNKCPIPKISCKKCCKKDRGGSFSPKTKNITICENLINSSQSVIEAVVHELIHAWDDCKKADWTDCDQRACSEIHAANLSGQCAKNGKWRRKGESYAQCVSRLAAKSTSTDKKCGNGVAHVKKMWKKCFNDKSPLK